MLRISPSELDKLRIKFEQSRIYQITSPAIGAVSGGWSDLSPEELWYEAQSIIGEIRPMDMPNRRWQFKHLYSKLQNRYRYFTDSNGNTITRSLEEASHTTYLVLFDVVYILSIAAKKDSDHVEEHPYYYYIKEILSNIGHSTLFKLMLDKTREEEEDLELLYGEELSPIDALNPTNSAESIQCPLTNIETNQVATIIQILTEAANQKKNNNAKYDGANRDHLSCALVALEEMQLLPKITTHYDAILKWLRHVLNMPIDGSNFRECFDTSSEQKRKKTQQYKDIFESQLKS